MYCLANGAKVGASTLAIKQRGYEPVLIVVDNTATRLLRQQYSNLPRESQWTSAG